MTTAPEANVVGQCAVHAPPVATKSENRTRAVVALTAVMMVIELLVGWWTHSLALLADGWHMGTHVGALGISALAYWYARSRAGQTEFAFGTGKVYALAGYSSAGLLIAVAIGVIVESVSRMLNPQTVMFAEAFPVAVLGLVVNLVSAWLLDVPHEHSHDHGSHDHDHHHDHNLRAAYLHVVADVLTSVLAIVALLGGRFLHWTWLDPVVAVFGALVILKWGAGLVRECGRQLIDLDPSKKHREKVIAALEGVAGTKVMDLHLWRVGPRQLVCMVSVASSAPRPLEEYKQVVLGAVPVDHLTVEICTSAPS